MIKCSWLVTRLRWGTFSIDVATTMRTTRQPDPPSRRHGRRRRGSGARSGRGPESPAPPRGTRPGQSSCRQHHQSSCRRHHHRHPPQSITITPAPKCSLGLLSYVFPRPATCISFICFGKAAPYLGEVGSQAVEGRGLSPPGPLTRKDPTVRRNPLSLPALTLSSHPCSARIGTPSGGPHACVIRQSRLSHTLSLQCTDWRARVWSHPSVNGE
jgi:hypothetical protein